MNPYRPPGTSSWGESLGAADDVLGRGRRFPLLWTLALLAYGVFTITLLRGGPLDRTAGIMFVPNCLALAGGVVAATIDYRRSPRVGTVAAAIQALVLIVMLAIGFGDLTPVVMINGGIIAAFLAIGIVYRSAVRRSLRPRPLR